jgi:hypothetical protein
MMGFLGGSYFNLNFIVFFQCAFIALSEESVIFKGLEGSGLRVTSQGQFCHWTVFICVRRMTALSTSGHFNLLIEMPKQRY